MRTFEDHPAVRARVPLLVGLVGPSGGGKTYSALRLATGMQRHSSGRIYYIDTEAGRALHYAEEFDFQHVPFEAPFGPLDYKAAIEHCVAGGAGVIVIDSGSHEHEGEGGVLWQHDREAERLAAKWKTSIEKASMSAWQKPKAERAELLRLLTTIKTPIIMCFRSKEKLKIVKGRDPVPLGWQAIAGDEFVYEMTVNVLLLPGAGGVPTWKPAEPAERAMVKLPGWAQRLFTDGRPLDEDVGEKLAEWAAGAARAPSSRGKSVNDLLEAYVDCPDAAAFDALERERRAVWPRANADQKAALKAASEAARVRVGSEAA